MALSKSEAEKLGKEYRALLSGAVEAEARQDALRGRGLTARAERVAARLRLHNWKVSASGRVTEAVGANAYPYWVRMPSKKNLAIEASASKYPRDVPPAAKPSRKRIAMGSGVMTDDMQTASYARAIERGDGGSENLRCVRCGKQITDEGGNMVQWTAAPGWFDVGSDCAKKLQRLGVEVRSAADI